MFAGPFRLLILQRGVAMPHRTKCRQPPAPRHQAVAPATSRRRTISSAMSVLSVLAPKTAPRPVVYAGRLRHRRDWAGVGSTAKAFMADCAARGLRPAGDGAAGAGAGDSASCGHRSAPDLLGGRAAVRPDCVFKLLGHDRPGVASDFCAQQWHLHAACRRLGPTRRQRRGGCDVHNHGLGMAK